MAVSRGPSVPNYEAAYYLLRTYDGTLVLIAIAHGLDKPQLTLGRTGTLATNTDGSITLATMTP